MPKRTPEEILKSNEESAVDAEIERVLSMSEEERRAELRAAGYDLKELHARGLRMQPHDDQLPPKMDSKLPPKR